MCGGHRRQSLQEPAIEKGCLTGIQAARACLDRSRRGRVNRDRYSDRTAAGSRTCILAARKSCRLAIGLGGSENKLGQGI
jgi:hypothetical protein